MQMSDSVVMDWLSGGDGGNGAVNPAGPLYIQGADAMEAAMADPSLAITLQACSLQGGTTCSFSGGCLCC